MSRTDTFESALATAFARLADMAPVTVDAGATTAAASAAPAVRMSGPLGADRGRRMALVGIAALLALTAALALLGAAHFLERPGRDVFGTFSQVHDFPPSIHGPRYVDAAAMLHDGRVLAVGMYVSSEPGDAWAYVFDPRTDRWSETGQEAAYRQQETATTLDDGRVLIVGGWRVDINGNPVLPAVGELYDPSTGAFTQTHGLLTTPRYGHTATLLADGRVLIVGGSGADFNATVPELASAEIFDPSTGLFTPTGSMTEPRQDHAATRLADGRVLVTGGTTSNDVPAVATSEIFDPAHGTFTPTGPMAAARSAHAMTVLSDGRVLVVGGTGSVDASGNLPTLASAELFDPALGRFTPAPSLTTERSKPTATLLPDGRVLVAGGLNLFGAPRTAEVFDPVGDRFVAAGATVAPHGGAWAAMLPDQRVLLIGTTQDPEVTAAPEAWTALAHPITSSQLVLPAAPAFTPLADPSGVVRTGNTATRLADGRVLLTGGFDSSSPYGQPTRTAELLDPRTGRSIAVGDMAKARWGHVAVLLADGRVLVAGGEQQECPPPTGECTWPVPSAEIFDPATRTFTTSSAHIGPTMTSGFGGSSAAVDLADGHVLYVGPSDSGETRGSSVIDPVAGTATTVAAIPCATDVSLVRLPDGRVFGLCQSQEGGSYLYEPSGEHVTRLTDADAWDAAVGLADGRVFVVRTTGSTAIFDPASGGFTASGSVSGQGEPDVGFRSHEPYPRRLTLLADGRVLITGGRMRIGGALRSAPAADLFDPTTGTSSVVGPMNAARYQQSSTLLKDGRVLLAGGVTRSPDRTDPEPALFELFDPDKIERD